MGCFRRGTIKKNPVNLVVKNTLREKVQQQVELLVEKTVINNSHNNLELPKSDMNRLDDNIPIIKVRHLKRLHRTLSPNPPEMEYMERDRFSPTHWSKESDHEKEIELKEKIERPILGKESDEEPDNDEFNGDDANVY
jgi:hypothetical protein